MKKILFLAVLSFSFVIMAQSDTKLVMSIENIMRDPKWIGISLCNIRWSEEGSKIYFDWNGKRSNDLKIIEGIYDKPGYMKDYFAEADTSNKMMKKYNWDVAFYPVENHGFVQPSTNASLNCLKLI